MEACLLLVRTGSQQCVLSLLGRRKDGPAMHFYALQVTCETCKSPFLVGGSPENDLGAWRNTVVECLKCGTAFPASAGEVVDLTSSSSAIDVRRFVRELTSV
jgi:hypothetical protein